LGVPSNAAAAAADDPTDASANDAANYVDGGCNTNDDCNEGGWGDGSTATM
jgi:hypothetical protein